MTMRWFLVAGCIAALALAMFPAQSATFTVTKTTDSGPGSLRDAIAQANGNGVADFIIFAAALKGKAIRPATPLPALTERETTINGDVDGNGRPDIILDGAMADGTGIEIRSASNVVRGLNIRRCANGVWIHGTAATANLVAGNYIGTNLQGTAALANEVGVYVSGLASRNFIGGRTRADRNVISGNALAGVYVDGADNVTIVGNYIGTDYRGLEGLGNVQGVTLKDCQNARIGDGTTGGRNVISGQSYYEGYLAERVALRDRASQGPGVSVAGILILRGAGHRVQGNFIGTDYRGTAEVGNAASGVFAAGTANCTIGGTTPRQRNVISGNNTGLTLTRCRDVTIAGNYIGTDAKGVAAVPNSNDGVSVQDSLRTTIGGTKVASRNIISGNGGTGITIGGGRDNFVLRNYIGLSRTAAALGNHGYGASVNSTARAWVGGTTAGSGNVISANGNHGINVYGGSVQQTTITRNVIGRDPTGATPIPNAGDAIYVGYAATNGLTIGGANPARGNRISCAKSRSGIHFYGGDQIGVMVRCNDLLGPAGGAGNRGYYGIYVDFAYYGAWPLTGRIADNHVQWFDVGLMLSGSGVAPVVTCNTLSDCESLVLTSYDAKPNLGNLDNLSTGDDGGNIFRNAGTYAVFHQTAGDIYAQGNDWGTSSDAAIQALIYDHNDSAGSGYVLYDPIIGGVHPSGLHTASLQLTGLAAVPVRAGAEIAFSLSAPAQVSGQILNLVGRPVALLAPRSAESGLTRMSWNGRSAQGTAVPAGLYLVRLIARDGSGTQSSALAQVRLER
jgi:hypothetical protein